MSARSRLSMPNRYAVACSLVLCAAAVGQQSPYIYGIHDSSPSPQEWLDRVAANGATSWVTATVAIGHDPAQMGGDDFRWISNQGHAVIARLNNGYGTTGTIPVPSEYGNFAQRCANYAAATQGCTHFVIGNETNLSSEWPKVGNWRSYISPQSYADCFRLCYDAIKAVRPDAQVISQGLAPFAGPYGAGVDHDGNPLGWTTYMNQMLTAINSTGGIDGIAAHINSRGYTYADVHSTAKVNGQYFSFYVYKDWVNLGTPASMRTLPYYATECNGIYFWKGGHEECLDGGNPSCTYQADWIEWIYNEINSWNQSHAATGQGIYRCVNMYRWCNGCDGWNIDGAPQESQILTDLGQSAALGYRWATHVTDDPPSGANVAPGATSVQVDSTHGVEWAGENAVDGVVSVESKWASSGSSPPHWLALDLGSTKTVTGFIIRFAGDAGEPTSYNGRAMEFQTASSMAGPWSTDVSIGNPSQASVINRSYVTPKNLRYVRLNITDTGVDNWARVPEFEVYAQVTAPTAAFTASPRTGSAPLDVQFTNQSTGTITTYAWNFGDGGSSSSANPSHEYANPGTYNVTLSVSGPGGSDAEFKPGYISVTAPHYRGDLDDDDDVDQEDFGLFQACMSGNGNPHQPGCEAANIDNDTDVDVSDFALFQACFSGANITPAAACLE